MDLDVLFINPGNHTAIYQDLAKDFSAIETPTWALLLAESVRSIGYKTAILDVNAERLSLPEAVKKVASVNTRLICFVVYGQNPNSGTVNMSGTIELANSLKMEGIDSPVCAVGSHVSALPKEILENEPALDFVLCNEGVYALRNLLATDLRDPKCLGKVRGIGYRVEGKAVLTHPERVVPQERMDIEQDQMKDKQRNRTYQGDLFLFWVIQVVSAGEWILRIPMDLCSRKLLIAR